MTEKIEDTIRKILNFLHITTSDMMIVSFVQFVKFGIIGASNTIIGYLLNVFVLLFLEKYNVWWDYIAGNLISFFLSVLWSFYWNNKYVFKVERGKKRSLMKTLIKTYISYSFSGVVLNNILSLFWINVLNISKYVAPFFNMVISVPVNFLINKFWAYKENGN